MAWLLEEQEYLIEPNRLEEREALPIPIPQINTWRLTVL